MRKCKDIYKQTPCLIYIDVVLYFSEFTGQNGHIKCEIASVHLETSYTKSTKTYQHRLFSWINVFLIGWNIWCWYKWLNTKKLLFPKPHGHCSWKLFYLHEQYCSISRKFFQSTDGRQMWYIFIILWDRSWDVTGLPIVWDWLRRVHIAVAWLAFILN